VSARVKDPKALYVRVRARPDQRVEGDWSILCLRGSAARERFGVISAVTPIQRRVRLPYSRPDQCHLTAFARLAGEGDWVKVALLARV
jgi:hypothetical protein